MNSHFQSSDTTSMVIGFTLDSSGRNGSSSCVVFQVMVPSTRMMAMGTAHTTASIRWEYDQLGMYWAEVFEARYFHANTSVSTMTGITTMSISSVETMIRCFSSAAILPAGSSNAAWQPLRSEAV